MSPRRFRCFAVIGPLFCAIVLPIGPVLGPAAWADRDDRIEARYGEGTPAALARLRQALARELAEVQAMRAQLAAELERARELRVWFERQQAELRERSRVVRVGDLLQDRAAATDVVVVTVEGGTLEFWGRDRHYVPFAFELAPGEKKRVRYTERDGWRHDRLEVSRSRDGRTIYFGSDGRRPPSFIDRGWRRGVTYAPVSSRHAGGEPCDVVITIRTEQPAWRRH